MENFTDVMETNKKSSSDLVEEKAREIFPLLNGLCWFEIERTLERVKDIYSGYPIYSPRQEEKPNYEWPR
ncbi:MAG TPA: hypothetical protein VEC12_00215 [Bacteroidia bacterium]|nr:hypothetical protein [Bacteroidia bacterium]